VNSVTLSLGITLPHPFPDMMNVFSIFSLDFLPFRCFTSHYFNETYLWSVLPLLITIITILYFAVRASCVVKDIMSIEHRLHQLRFLFERCVTYILLMTYLVLPPVSLKQFQGLNCQSIRGESFLRVDTSIDCNSASYSHFRLINGLSVVIYMVIPSLWLYILWKQRRRLNPPTSDLRLAYHLRDKDAQLAYLSFLFTPYQPRFYFFESIEMCNPIPTPPPPQPHP